MLSYKIVQRKPSTSSLWKVLKFISNIENLISENKSCWTEKVKNKSEQKDRLSPNDIFLCWRYTQGLCMPSPPPERANHHTPRAGKYEVKVFTSVFCLCYIREMFASPCRVSVCVFSFLTGQFPSPCEP